MKFHHVNPPSASFSLFLSQKFARNITKTPKFDVEIWRYVVDDDPRSRIVENAIIELSVGPKTR